MKIINKLSFYSIGLVASLFFSISIFSSVFAANTVSLSATVSGSLNVDIVDSNGDTVGSPSVTMSGISYSNTASQTSTGTMPSGTDKIRVTNPTTTATWSLTIAATSGATATWTTGAVTFDFNDSTASAGDGADADSVGGQLTVNPNAGTLAGTGSTATTNVSKGSSTAFVEGSTNSVTVLSASAGAAAPGQWDLTGVSLSQTVPAQQVAGTYTLGFTLTIS